MAQEFRWKILQLVWWSKGFDGKEASDLLQKECPNVSGLAYQTVNSKVCEDKVAPPEVAEYIIHRMPVKEGNERRAEIVRLGLAALQGEPLPEGSKPEQAAQDLRTEFPADEVAAKLADALSKQGGLLDTLGAKLNAVASALSGPLDALASGVAGKLDALASGVAGKLDTLASGVAGKLDTLASGVTGKLDALATSLVSMLGSLFATLDDVRRSLNTATGKLDAATGKLDVMEGQLDHLANAVATVAATVNHLDAKDDVADYQRARDTRRILRAVWCVGGLVSLVVVGVHCQPAPTPSEAEALVRAALTSVLNMGKRTEEHWIPKEPAPWQKLAKDCDQNLGEEPINGGCWVALKHVQPPCGKLFRYGDTCYRPVAADPTKGTSVEPE